MIKGLEGKLPDLDTLRAEAGELEGLIIREDRLRRIREKLSFVSGLTSKLEKLYKSEWITATASGGLVAKLFSMPQPTSPPLVIMGLTLGSISGWTNGLLNRYTETDKPIYVPLKKRLIDFSLNHLAPILPAFLLTSMGYYSIHRSQQISVDYIISTMDKEVWGFWGGTLLLSYFTFSAIFKGFRFLNKGKDRVGLHRSAGRDLLKKSELEDMTEVEQAIGYLERSIEVGYDINDAAWLVCGYFALGKSRDAIDTFGMIIKEGAKFRSDTPSILSRFEYKERSGSIRENLELFEKYYNGEDKEFALLIVGAMYELFMGNDQKLEECFDSIVRKKPEDPISYSLRGQFYVSIGQDERAWQDFQKAKRLLERWRVEKVSFGPSRNPVYCYEEPGGDVVVYKETTEMEVELMRLLSELKPFRVPKVVGYDPKTRTSGMIRVRGRSLDRVWMNLTQDELLNILLRTAESSAWFHALTPWFESEGITLKGAFREYTDSPEEYPNYPGWRVETACVNQFREYEQQVESELWEQIIGYSYKIGEFIEDEFRDEYLVADRDLTWGNILLTLYGPEVMGDLETQFKIPAPGDWTKLIDFCEALPNDHKAKILVHYAAKRRYIRDLFKSGNHQLPKGFQYLDKLSFSAKRVSELLHVFGGVSNAALSGYRRRDAEKTKDDPEAYQRNIAAMVHNLRMASFYSIAAEELGHVNEGYLDAFVGFSQFFAELYNQMFMKYSNELKLHAARIESQPTSYRDIYNLGELPERSIRHEIIYCVQLASLFGVGLVSSLSVYEGFMNVLLGNFEYVRRW